MFLKGGCVLTQPGNGEEAEQDEGKSGDRFVVLMRHGIAEDRTDAKPDEERALTDEGNDKMKGIGRGLAQLFPKAEVIYSSPLVRCVQTSLWLSKSYGDRIGVKTTHALVPSASPDDLRQLLDQLKEHRRIVVVGHEPTLSRDMASLTGMVGMYPFELKKGGCYGLRIPAGSSAMLEWVLTPRVLRRLR